MNPCRLYLIGFVFIILGLYLIVCAIIKRGWFTNLYSTRLFVQLFGHAGARICSLILGLLLIMSGTAFINFCQYLGA